MYKSFVSLGRYTPKYFILSVAMVNGIVSLISLYTARFYPREMMPSIPKKIHKNVHICFIYNR